MAEYIFGKDSKQIFVMSEIPITEPPEKYGTGWFLMSERRPRIVGHTFAAQSDGTWLDITTSEALLDVTDKGTVETKYENIMGTLEGLPVSQDTAFILMYNEIQEYYTHGTVGNLLLGIAETSGMTGSEITAYLASFYNDMKSSLGKVIGRRLV